MANQKDKIIMNRRELKREHKRLILILEKGTLAQRMKEAKSQSKEAVKYGLPNKFIK